jgi:hypothetical protein
MANSASRALAVLVASATASIVATAVPALAHERRVQGDHVFVVGWLDEPAFAGFKNAVQFIASHGNEPLEGAEVEVEVIFGEPDSEERTEAMPLEAAFGTPGEYHAFLIPTRPGTYSFHVTGTLEGSEQIDEMFTSGPDTFNDVQEPTEVQFPVQDPTTGELSEAVTRLQERVERATTELATAHEDLSTAAVQAEDAKDSASLARLLAIIALVVGAAAVVVAVLFRRRPAAP